MPELEAWWRCRQGEGRAQGQDAVFSGAAESQPGHVQGEGALLRWLLALGNGLLIAATCLAWWPATTYNMARGGFFMDDAMIKKNANVYEEIEWRRLLRTDYWGLEMFEDGQWTHKSFRPLTVLTFRWNYWLHTFDSSGFHVTNLALHAASSALLGLFGWAGLGLPAGWSTLLAALFFAHPVHTESVLYIVGRADILCCALVLLAILTYMPCIAGRTRGALCASARLVLAALLLVTAGLCKETGFCFFGWLAGWEILRCLRPVGSHRVQSMGARYLRLVALLALGATACYGRVWYTAGTAIERMDPHSNPVAAAEDRWVRVLSYALVHGLYAKLLVWPTFLCYDYSLDAVPLVRAPEDARLLVPIAAYLGFAQLLCGGLRLLRPPSRRGPSEPNGCAPRGSDRAAHEGPAVGAAVVVLSFLPMSNIFFPVGTMIGERLLYIPSAGLLIMLVSIAYLSSSRRGAPVLWATLLLIGGSAGAWLCARRVPEWHTANSITVVDGLKQPRSSRVQFNYANVHLQEKRYDEALFTYQRAISVDPTDHDSLPLYHSGQILFYQGRQAEAEAYLAKAVAGYYSPLTIKEEEIFHDYGLVLWHARKPHDAILNFQKSLALNPSFTKALNNQACAAGYGAYQGSLPWEYMNHGLQSLEQALVLEPANILYWRNAVALLQMARDNQAALGAWQRVMAMDPQGAGAGPPQECVWEFYFR